MKKKRKSRIGMSRYEIYKIYNYLIWLFNFFSALNCVLYFIIYYLTMNDGNHQFLLILAVSLVLIGTNKVTGLKGDNHSIVTVIGSILGYLAICSFGVFKLHFDKLIIVFIMEVISIVAICWINCSYIPKHIYPILNNKKSTMSSEFKVKDRIKERLKYILIKQLK